MCIRDRVNPQIRFPSNDTANFMSNPNFMAMPQNLLVTSEQDPSQMNYYQESCKLYIANVVLTTQMKELVTEKNEILAKIAKLERGQNNSYGLGHESLDDKKKRHRRTAGEIDRHYKCPVETC
eukprot:TRINITY_DN21709_c0_g1_i3.p3 TRINITY_DN21709_c0_g1~~TRINITY_DN21709_c0_g1_i3.p3  ORF type:complete len:123 (-),score=16.28 TRINITY_DN21709_c0_g1_i3:137-505(-)